MLSREAAMAAVKTSCACTLLGVPRRSFPAFLALVPDLTQRITAIGDLRAKLSHVDVGEEDESSEQEEGSSSEEAGNNDGSESKELAELRSIYQSLDVEGSGSVDEWQLFSFISKAEDVPRGSGAKRGSLPSNFGNLMSFEEMQQEMALVDIDGDGTIDWEEFTALMLGKVAGAENLAAAMRTAYVVDTKLRRRSLRHGGNRRAIGFERDSVSMRMLSGESERPFGDALIPVLRAVLGEELPDDVAAVIRVIAPDGSRVQLNATAPSGKQGMFAEGGDDQMHSSLLGDGEMWGAWSTFYLRDPGDGVLLGARPRNEFVKLLSTRFNVDASVPCTCKASVPMTELQDTFPPDNMFLLRFEEGVAIRIQSLMPRSNAMHLFRPTDSTMRTLWNEVGNGGRLTLDQELGLSKYNEELVTAHLAPLFFNTRIDSSHVLPIRSTRRNIFALHLLDVNIPLTVVISTNPNGPQA
jgi:hypothetical protein